MSGTIIDRHLWFETLFGISEDPLHPFDNFDFSSDGQTINSKVSSAFPCLVVFSFF